MGHSLDEILSTRGIRSTSQRRFVLSTLRDRPDEHLSADEVYDIGRASVVTLSRPTAYSALAELARGGIIHAISGTGAALYGYGNGGDHAHFLCRSCGSLVDVQAADRRQEIRLADPSFVADEQRVLFIGCCAGCAPTAQPD